MSQTNRRHFGMFYCVFLLFYKIKLKVFKLIFHHIILGFPFANMVGALFASSDTWQCKILKLKIIRLLYCAWSCKRQLPEHAKYECVIREGCNKEISHGTYNTLNIYYQIIVST